jgi:hypothetical protein
MKLMSWYRKIEKIIWNFAEWCLNIPLLEKASERNSKLEKIESKSETINLHFFKYYIMPNSIDRNHWLSEINDRFYEIQKLVWGKGKRFRKEEYFEILYNRFYTKDISIDYRNLERIFSKIEKRYKGELIIEYTINDFIERISFILKNISELLEDGDYDEDELIRLIKTLN